MPVHDLARRVLGQVRGRVCLFPYLLEYRSHGSLSLFRLWLRRGLDLASEDFMELVAKLFAAVGPIPGTWQGDPGSGHLPSKSIIAGALLGSIVAGARLLLVIFLHKAVQLFEERLLWRLAVQITQTTELKPQLFVNFEL